MLRIAVKHAAKSTYIYRLGAVITKGSRVIATGHNSISFCKINSFNNSRHAEMDVILKVLRQPDGLVKLAGATMYISRITQTGRQAMARPCKKCMDLIRSVGIKDIIYTTDTGQQHERI